MSARLGLALVAVLALVADAGGAPGRVVQSTPSPIVGLGLQGGRLFWTLSACTDTHMRPLAGGRPVLLGDANRTDCDHGEGPHLVAYARGRVLWSAQGSGNNIYENVTTGAPGERPKLLEEVIGSSGGDSGDYLTGVAGGGLTIAYSIVSVGMLDTCIEPGTPCDRFITASRTMRVVGRRAVRVPGVPPAARLAAGGGRIAVDVANDHDGRNLVRAGRIEIRDAASGGRNATIATTGNVLELALSREVLAVLVRHGGRKAIERYEPKSGRLLGRTPVYGNAHELAVFGTRVVFLSGRTVREVGIGIVATAATQPNAVAIEGRRLVWAETAGRTGRIVLAEIFAKPS